ncbi:type VI secretion system Vgr family protein [Polyangium mundeleinium]
MSNGLDQLRNQAQQRPNLSVTVASGDALDVRRFSVREAMSSLFEVNLTVHTDEHDIDFDRVLGQPARFTIHAGHERFWAGICNHIQHVGGDEKGQSIYRLTIVPELWLLTQRRDYYMFQQKSELDIALEVLDDWGIEPVRKLSGTYKKRKYRVQYAETDYTFLCRMLEDAGISFYFEQSEDKMRLVLADAPQRAEPRAHALAFHDDVSMVTGEYVTQVNVGQEVRPGRYTMRDHDYRRAANFKLMSSAEGANVEIEKKLERYHYTPGAFLFGATKGDDTPSADDKGKARTDEGEAAQLAQKRLEAKRANAKTCTFMTNALDLAPGLVFQIKGHLREKLNRERQLVVEAVHEGTSYGETVHHCVSRSAEVPYRPPVETPKPKVNGVESATVVGPPGEEIHTDEFGRVRVHFHWDRASQMDDNSSCWIHVSQPWGGAGYGATNLPRIGQEVLVDFLGGDPDRPVIVGRVYTNLQKTPYKLPENKTQSGWKSNSTGGGGGYNEIMFEDAVGKELVRMQAEKDLTKLVKNDESVMIGRDRESAIGNNESQTVGNDFIKLVMNCAREMVGMNRARGVGNDETVEVGRHQVVAIGKTQTTNVGEKIEIVCGESRIVMEKSGRIVISGSDITVSSTGHVQVWGDPIDLN